MKVFTLPIVAALWLSVTARSQTNSLITKKQNAMETTTIVQDILQTLENGWNSANGMAFAQPFADSSDFVDIRGSLHQQASRQFLGEAHQGVFMGIYKDSKITYSLVQAQLIDGNTILANAGAALDAPSGPLAGKSASTISLVIIKAGNEWKIRAFHNTLVAKQ